MSDSGVNDRRVSRRDFLKYGGAALGTSIVAPGVLARSAYAGTRRLRAARPLVIGAPATPTGFDREFNVTTADLEQSSNIFAPALTWATQPAVGIPRSWDVFEQNAFKLAENAIERWELTDGGKTLVLHLRKGMISNFGNELTAADAVWSYQRVYPLHGASSFFFFEGGYGDPKTSKVSQIDKYSFSITAEYPNAMLERTQASVWQWFYDSTEAKKHATSGDPWATNWLKSNYCGYGPYTVSTFSPNVEVAYTANPHWWKGTPAIESVIYRQVPTDSSRVALLESGQINVAEFLRPDELKKLQSSHNVRVLYFRGNYQTYLVPNQGTFKPFKNLLVRQALCYATPQHLIGQSIYNGRGAPMRSVIPPTYPDYNGSYFHYGYDPAKARELLKKAGYSHGLQFTVMYTDAIPELENVAIALQTAYKQVGVNIQLDKRPASTYFDSLYGPHKNYQAALSRELAVVPDPVHATYQFFYSKSVIDTAQVRDPALDKILLQALRAPAASRKAVFNQVQKIIMGEAIWIPIWVPGNQVAISSNLQGYTWQFNNGFNWGACRFA